MPAIFDAMKIRQITIRQIIFLLKHHLSNDIFTKNILFVEWFNCTHNPSNYLPGLPSGPSQG